MTCYFVSRHQATIYWAYDKGIIAEYIPHLNIERVKKDDVIIGTLPVSLAAMVCDKNARYIHVHLDIPQTKRGEELSVEDLKAFGIKLIEYEIKQKANFKMEQ